MSAGYVKIYGSILGSSVWSESPTTRILWITLLALADKDGHVEASVPGLARFANISVDDTRTALMALAAPDPESKSPEYDGRRIEKDEGGWRILNYLKYREMQSAKQIADAQRAKEYRDRLKAEKADSPYRDASQTFSAVATTATEDEAATATAGKSSSSSGMWKPILEAELANRLPTDAGRIALSGILAVARIKAGVVAELNTCLSGQRGDPHHCSLAELDVALSDYFGNGMSNDGQWNATHFRGCIRAAKRGTPEPRTSLSSPRRSSIEDAAQSAVTSIRALIQRNGQSAFIPKQQVEALGGDVLGAYLAVGGATRFLTLEPDKLPWLVKEFASALRAPGVTHAA